MDRALDWLFTTPWYVPAALAVIITSFLIYTLRESQPVLAPSDQILASPQPIEIAPDTDLQDANSTKLQDRIYVARMFVDVHPLDADHYVSIGAACLNLYDRTLTLRQTSGVISLAYRSSEPGSSYETVSLMAPQVLGDFSEPTALPKSKFSISLNQIIPGAHVTRLSETLHAGGIVEFNFSDLQLELVSSSGEEYYFKLWHGVHISFSTESPYINRVTIGTGTTRRNIVRPI